MEEGAAEHARHVTTVFPPAPGAGPSARIMDVARPALLTPRRTDDRAVASPPHSALDDAAGLLVGTFLVSLGLTLLHAVSAVTGGTAGLALLLSYALPVPFGVVFVLANAPFFALAAVRNGLAFTIRSAICIVLVSLLPALHAAALPGLHVHPVYAVLGGDALCGVGLLIVFRHGGSLGGFNVLALLAQRELGWRAGYVQMALDVAVVAAAFAVVAPALVGLSAAGAVLLNLVIAMNHRPGRYLGM